MDFIEPKRNYDDVLRLLSMPMPEVNQQNMLLQDKMTSKINDNFLIFLRLAPIYNENKLNLHKRERNRTIVRQSCIRNSAWSTCNVIMMDLNSLALDY